MGTGIPVVAGEIISHEKMNLKLETIAEGGTKRYSAEERQLETEYHNETGRTVLVVVDVGFNFPEHCFYADTIIQRGNQSGILEYVDEAYTEMPTIPVYLLQRVQTIVTPGQYYKVKTYNSGANEVAIWWWTETIL